MGDLLPGMVIGFMLLAALMVVVPYGAASLTDLKSRRHKGERTRVFIWGAGALGQQLMMNLLTDKEHRQKSEFVGFIDDAPKKIGITFKASTLTSDGYLKMKGYPVLAGISAMPERAKLLGVKKLIMAILEIDDSRVEQVKRICEENEIAFVDGRKCSCIIP